MPLILTLTLTLTLTLAAPASDPPSPHLPPHSRLLRTALDQSQADLLSTLQLHPDHSTWEDPWVVESAHYVVKTVHSRHLAVELGESLDQALGWFQDLLGTDWAPSAKVPVHVLPSLADFNRLGQEINADEHSSFYGAFYAATHPEQPLAVLYNGNHVFLRMQATHAALHQFVAQAFGQEPPYWVSEGLASYFAHYWNYAYLCAEHRRLVEGDRFLPLLGLTRATAGNFGDRSHDKMMELGALFNYLLHRRPDTMEVREEDGTLVQWPFRDLVRSAVRGKSLLLDPTYLALLARLPTIEEEFRGYTFPP